MGHVEHTIDQYSFGCRIDIPYVTITLGLFVAAVHLGIVITFCAPIVGEF